ncbi:MAG: tetratricopeptide repeat protein [Phycisphaerae bacterium]
MLRQLAMIRASTVLLVWLVITLAGCTADGRRGIAPRDGRSELSPDVDPVRAHMPLSRIEPLPSKPVRPNSLKPLSERAAGQIATARGLVEEQRYTEAAIELERALRYDPNHPRIHRALAMLHWEAGNLERAKRHVARVLEINPDDATAHYIAGRCHALTGDTTSAITAYRTALLCSDIGRDPQIAAMSHYHLAEALSVEGYLEASLGQYQAFEHKVVAPPEAPGRPEPVAGLQVNRRNAALAKSDIFEGLGRFHEAAKVLAPLVSDSPDDLALGLRYVRLLTRAGRLDEALTAVRAIPSDDDEAVELLFEIHKRAGRPERIIEDLRLRITDRPDEPRLVLHLADKLMRLDRVSEAGRELQAYLSGYPNAEAIRARLVDVHITRSAWGDALRVCAEGIERHPERPDQFEGKIAALASNKVACRALLTFPSREESAVALYLRGKLAVAADQEEKAERFLRKSYSQQADFVPARVTLARVYLRLLRYDEAIQVAARAHGDAPEDARLELVLGEVYERLDDVMNAELHFKAAIQLNRSDPAPMFALARLYKQSGRRLQAQRQLRVLLEQDPNHEAARELLAFSYLEEGKGDVAVEHFEELAQRATAQTKTRCEALLNLIRGQEPDVEAYRRALRESMEQHGPDAATWLAIAESYDTDSEPQRQREAYRNTLAIDPESEEAAIGLVQTSQRLLDFEQAAERLETLLRRRPNRHSWRLGLFGRQRGLVELYWIIQDYDAALALARREEGRDDLDDLWRQRYRVAIIETLRQMGRSDEVLTQLKEWTDAEPDNQTWSIRLAQEYVNQKQPLRALPIFQAVYNSDPADPRNLARLVESLLAAGQTQRASQYALDWLNDDPENDRALEMLASVLAAGDRPDEALELVRNKLLHTPNREAFQNFLIDRLFRTKRHEACTELTEALIDEVLRLLRDPGGVAPSDRISDEQRVRLPDEHSSPPELLERLTTLRMSLAQNLIAAKQYREARQHLSAWLDSTRDPGSRFAFLRVLAYCYQMQHEEEQAAKVMERALLLRPDHVGTNNDVAYGWIDRGIRLGEAERMIRYALSQEPRQGAYLDTYGWLLYKKGVFAEAKKWLLLANRARGEDDAVIHDHLGDTCWRLDQAEEAIEHWTAAVASVRGKAGDEFSSEDERRVRDATQQKIDDAHAGRGSAVAPLAAEMTEQ